MSKLILLGYRHPSCKLYTPTRNKKKLAFLGVLAIPFLITPATNWLYVLGLGVLTKVSPLWVYN